MDDSWCMDSYGLVHPQNPTTNGVSQNGPRWTSEYAWGYYQKFSDEFEDKKDPLRKAMQSCVVTRGVIRRHPTNLNEMEQIDDYIGAISASTILDDGQFAKDFLDYGFNQGWPKYNYNNVTPGKWTQLSWLGRFPQLICHAEFVAGRTPPTWRSIYWGLVILWGCRAKREDSDAWALSWHLVKAADHRGPRTPVIDWVRSMWIACFKNHYPNGMGQLLLEWGWLPNHPNVLNLWGDIGE